MRAFGAHGKLLALLLAGGSLLSAVAPPSARAEHTGGSDATPWLGAIHAMDEALARGDVRAALKAREDAYGAALDSRRWDGMADVGDATLRLVQRAGLRPAMEPEARRAYLSALFRARRQASLDGVLRATEAFAALGDRDVARRGFVIANALAAASREPHALERVRALQARLAAEAPLVGSIPATPLAPAPGAALTRENGGRGSQDAE